MKEPLKAFPRTFTALSRQSAFRWLLHGRCQYPTREAEKTNRKQFLTAIIIQRGTCPSLFLCSLPPTTKGSRSWRKRMAQGQEEYSYINFPAAPTSSLPLVICVCPHAWSWWHLDWVWSFILDWVLIIKNDWKFMESTKCDVEGWEKIGQSTVKSSDWKNKWFHICVSAVWDCTGIHFDKMSFTGLANSGEITGEMCNEGPLLFYFSFWKI